MSIFPLAHRTSFAQPTASGHSVQINGQLYGGLNISMTTQSFVLALMYFVLIA